MDDVACEKGDLQASLQQSHRKQHKVNDSSTCIQGPINCFSAVLKESCEYMEHLAGKKGGKMFEPLGSWTPK